MNPLVKILRDTGHIGCANPVHRSQIASWLNVPVRRIQEWAEESRLGGDPASVVGYSSQPDASGFYLCQDVAEISAVEEKILKECRRRLVQLRGLRTARHRLSEQTLFPL